MRRDGFAPRAQPIVFFEHLLKEFHLRRLSIRSNHRHGLFLREAMKASASLRSPQLRTQNRFALLPDLL